MFSGLVQTTGRVITNRGNRIEVGAALSKVRKGDSVAVNGVCLTVVTFAGRGKTFRMRFDVSPETLAKTTLRHLAPGTQVNLEKSLTLADALGGHLVQGHVDGVGRVSAVQEQEGGMRTVWFEPPEAVKPYLVEKGSVAVDGVSLTVADLKKGAFAVALIPYTLAHTNLSALRVGDAVNLEADIMAKYVYKYARLR